MRKKVCGKTKLIITLLVLIGLVLFVPIKEMMTKPSVIGAAVTNVYVRGTQNNYTCSAVFLEGWNLISLPCLAENTSIDNVLSSISGNYTSIHSYDPNNDTDPWKSYNPNIPSWVVHDLEDMDEEKGYWINMMDQDTLKINGTMESPHTTSIGEGWNLISYPVTTVKDITSALNSIDGNYNIVWLYNASNATYYYYDSVAGSGTLGEMRPYYGYWINMTGSDDWIIVD